MKFRGLLAIALITISTSVYAEDDHQAVSNAVDEVNANDEGAAEVMPPKRLRYLLGGGFTFGGDKLATVTYTDGSTDSITAGGMFDIHAGIDYRLNDDISLQGTLGYHFDLTKHASNGDVTFSRFPLEMMAYYHSSDVFRIGGGTRIVLNPKVEGTGLGSGLNMSFSNTFGLVVEGEYMVVPELGIKVRYVREKYKANGLSGSINGNHIGILTNLYF